MGVMENGSRICRGGVMQLEWWSPYSGCKGIRDQEKEAWIRVVGLPLHLWAGEILKKVGDSCGGFVAMDEGTASKTDLLWARILVKINTKAKLGSINLIAGDRSYAVQIWWEIRPTVAEMISKSSRTIGDPADAEEEDDREARAKGCVSPERAANCHSFRDGMREVGNLSVLGNSGAISRMEIGQTRGVSIRVGDKKMFEFQTVWELGGKSGRILTQGASEGPSTGSLGEKSVRPMGSISHITLQATSKGRIVEKTGMANPSCEETQECERSAVEDRDYQETNSSKDHGRRKSNDIK